RVLGRILSADLELAAAKPELAPLRHLVPDPGEVAAVVAADDVDADRVPVPAPELPERTVEDLADRVPERQVDAREGDEADPAVAELVERDRKPELPAALDREAVLADQPRRQLVGDDCRDVAQGRVLVARIGLPDDALPRGHAGEDRGAVAHPVVAAPVLLLERHDDRRHLD